MPSGRVSLTSTRTERILFQYVSNSTEPFQTGLLSDGKFSEKDGKISYLLANGELESIPLIETVSADLAIETAVYFLNHDQLPEGLTWHGRMDQYR